MKKLSLLASLIALLAFAFLNSGFSSKKLFNSSLDKSKASRSCQVFVTVTDDQGEPLAGASVIVKGSSVGVSTDINGRATINVPNGGYTLVFSYIGFQAQERVVYCLNNYLIVMKP